ncbi:cardiolipin synthase [Thioalkalivibrio sp. XN279]|uniref:cardiolipin synthase n=1 Tax=Thioalkalivibrio sp. XN279 TaxID=2714953 RepID=UPI00140A8A4B|nr:cardiolipin synthase [Thioalkalivibrio sp. XN279]NHA13799.1 cardiolipin synthase [Thioalkalivibrio sp. XN279]
MEVVEGGLLSALLLGGHMLLVAGLAVRILSRHLPVGSTLAWLVILFVLPLFGPALYLFIGENRLGNKRARRWTEIHDLYRGWQGRLKTRSEIDWNRLHPRARSLASHGESITGFVALQGHALELLEGWDDFVATLVADIDAARSTCHLEFYIWESAGRAAEVEAALVRAAERGVVCRVLVDDVGASRFLRSRAARALRAAGVQVVSQLPVGLLRMLFVRMDLRNHRKIVVIDGEIGYTGSMNLVDPAYFKSNAGVGRWVDAMVRLRGPAVEVLNGAFLEDWELETDEGMEVLETADLKAVHEEGDTVVQVVPSGPGLNRASIHQLLLSLLYSAERELILTTPYFVPDESIMTALVSAARRGVAVTLNVPQKLDSVLARYAGAACFEELLAAGVQIARYEPDLLHTKAITVDGRIAVLGSVNIDMRSLWLNFEISLFIYDRDCVSRVRELQARYLHDSVLLHPRAWRERSLGARVAEGVLRLMGPLL